MCGFRGDVVVESPHAHDSQSLAGYTFINLDSSLGRLLGQLRDIMFALDLYTGKARLKEASLVWLQFQAPKGRPVKNVIRPTPPCGVSEIDVK